MPFSIFVDALPYNEIISNYKDTLENMQVAEMIPNIAYSSSLHWQLYCNKYPDERGVLVDWVKESEKNKAVRIVSTLLSPLDSIGNLGLLSRKVLNKYIFRRNAFANIPYKLRKEFTQKGTYLFWKKETYRKEDIFDGFDVISQDEGHQSFEATIQKLETSINNKTKDIFAVFGFADSLGHKCKRGELYSARLKPYMEKLFSLIKEYKNNYPNEPVLIVSDHGMSTINNHLDINLEKKFGKQSKKTYIAYRDSAIMCVFCQDKNLLSEISKYLKSEPLGHLLTEQDREHYKATDRKFGDIIYILKEGTTFSNNWFGKSIKKPSPDGAGMHGFWPQWESKDQNACIILLDSSRTLEEKYDYQKANALITDIMKGGR